MRHHIICHRKKQSISHFSYRKIIYWASYMHTIKIRMGEDNSKWSNWQATNLKNIQATPTAQLQKNKWPNQKMGLCFWMYSLDGYKFSSKYLAPFFFFFSWLQSPSAVILEPEKIQSITVSIFPHVFPIWCEVMWLDNMIVIFSM